MQARVRKCEVYDSHVCSFEPDPSNIAKIVTLQGQPFCKQTSFIKQGQKVRLYANDAFLNLLISHRHNKEHEFVMEPISVNRSIDFLTPAGTMEAGGQSYQIFSRKGVLSADQSAIVDTTLIGLLERLRPAPEESIHIYASDMVIYLYHPSLERTLRTIDLASSFLEHLPRPVPQQSNLSELPPQFHPLIPLIKAWGISDDGEREERREQTSRAVLQRIVDEIRPYYGAINSYLDSFGDHPEPDAATALGALAEFAAETDLYLKEKTN
jgi:hypothetical protein